MKNLTIWLIGGSSVGKTEQARLLHKYFLELSGEKHELGTVTGGNENGVHWAITVMNDYSTNLGVLNDNQCSGTDILTGKERIMLAYEKALDTTPIVILEGIMSSGTYIDFLQKPGVGIVLIHLKTSLEVNLSRLAARRAEKTGKGVDEVEFSALTKKNTGIKLRNFVSLYQRMKDKVYLALEVDTDDKNIEEVFEEIREKAINKALQSL